MSLWLSNGFTIVSGHRELSNVESWGKGKFRKNWLQYFVLFPLCRWYITICVFWSDFKNIRNIQQFS